ncbi:MAG TPA: YciI family protein [Solirubrobacteraceae bacterium]|nr:YciI family protein [Solirubrobacteraceae bacterium]
MRVMVLIKANEQSEHGEMPSEKLLTEMTAFNEELVKAGVMLAGDGLHPSAKGVRVAFKGSERKVIDGPFAETKELLAGYWILQVKSLDEAVEWVKRIPAGDDDDAESIVEIRPVFETEDFGDELTPELREREAALRAQTEAAQ